MFKIHRAIARALSTTPIAIPRTRVITQFPSRTFVQCRPRWAEHSSQEQAATSESTDAVSSHSPAANESAPPADQAAAATSETTDQVSNISKQRPDPSRTLGGNSTHTVYVGNISFDTTEESLQNAFAKYGQIKGVDLIKNDLGRSKGFAFVHFYEEVPQLQAIRDSGLEELDGRRIFVQASHMDRRERPPGNSVRLPRRQESEPSKTLFIGNLSYQMSDRDLNDLFRDIRGILDVRVAISRTSGQPRGFAHADFRDIESAKEAKNLLEGKSVYGRALNVDFAKAASAYNGAR